MNGIDSKELLIIMTIFALIALLAKIFSIHTMPKSMSKAQASDSSASEIDELMRNLSLVENGVMVKKYALYDYISELPEYKLYMDEYKYITGNESKLRIISALNENAQINTKYLKDISHQINETSIMNKDKLKAAADINSLLTGALLVKKSLMIYAVRMIDENGNTTDENGNIIKESVNN